MADENDTKTSKAAGLCGTESPEKSPVDVPHPSNEVHVYAIGCGDYVKIGIAANVEKRLRALQTANPTPLTLLDSRPFATKERALVIEWCIHGELVDQHSSGEWFRRQPVDPLVWLDFYHDQDLKLRV